MRALFIGGTGTISSAITRKLAKDPSWELWLINRGNRADTVPENVHQIVCDINDEDAVKNASYILYAYLGGQARRDITYVTDQG